jgi:sulfite exporter TauE/SafE
MGRYRGWVYGAGFGLQLGTGVVTIVTTAAVYATFALATLSGSAAAGALIGAIFGLVRGGTLLLTADLHTPAQVRALHRRVAATAPWARSVTVASLVVLPLLAALSRG